MQQTKSMQSTAWQRGHAHPRASLRRVRCAYGPHYTVYTPPSSATALNELQWLAKTSTILPESPLTEGKGRTVSFALLRAIATSERLGIKPLQNALTSARTVDSSPDKQVDRALVNVGTILSEQVEGRISTEIDPRLANDKAALVAKARALAGLYVDLHVPISRLLFRIPATWAGVCAAQELEKEGMAVQLAMVHSLIQGVAAGQAGVSLINPRVGRTRDWFLKNPGAIRDPKGPRQDAGLGGGADPGIALVTQLFNYMKTHHPKTQIMASSIRSREDALALAGCDFMVLTGKVMIELERTPTTAGYNDGLTLSNPLAEEELEAQLTEERAREANPEAFPRVTEASFNEGLGLAGNELLAVSLTDAIKDADALGDLNRATTGVTST